MATSNNNDTETKNRRVAQIDPLAITESLGFQTFRRESRKPWTKEEDAELIKIISQLYPSQANILQPDLVKWDLIAQKISPNGTRKPKDCRKRWCNSLDPNLRKGKWTKEEDEQLIKAYEKYGPSWQKVSNEMTGRTDDQCAKRYIEVLDPNTKDRLKPWDHQEDLQLIRQVKIHGTKWRTIANEIKGRPSLTCRNRWRKLVTDVVRGKADSIIKKEVDLITNGNLRVIEKFGKKLENPSDSKDIELKLSTSISSSSSNTYQTPSSSISNQSSQKHKTNQSPPPQSPHPIPRSHEQPQRRPPSQSVITRPVNSEVEWRYTLTKHNDSPVNLPHNTLFNDENGGIIKNQELVQSLISYAKKFDLKITVHQHIHHHYSPPPVIPPAQPQDFTGYPHYQSMASPFNNILSSINNGNDFNNSSTSPPGEIPKNSSAYYLEPETQLTRFQHFNYLPPLTEVPKLNSSNSSPSSSSKGSSIHQHLHQHVQHHEDSSKRNSTVNGNQNSNKGSDIVKLLNQSNNDQSSENYEKTKAPFSSKENSPSSNSMTPLAHAVEIAAAAEASIAKRRANSEESAQQNKKSKYNDHSDEEDEGLDFWETMRNLTDILNQQTQLQNHQHQSHQSQLNQKPVSQHHPLHYNRGSATPQPTGTSASSAPNQSSVNQKSIDDEIDEDILNSYGLFYNVYTKEGSIVPETNQPQNNSAYDSLVNSFGIIPFNPS